MLASYPWPVQSENALFKFACFLSYFIYPIATEDTGNGKGTTQRRQGRPSAKTEARGDRKRKNPEREPSQRSAIKEIGVDRSVSFHIKILRLKRRNSSPKKVRNKRISDTQ